MKIVEYRRNQMALEILDEMAARTDHPAFSLFRDQIANTIENRPSVGHIDAARLAAEQTAFRRKISPIDKAPVGGINSDGQFALWGGFKTAAGHQVFLVLVLPEGYPENPPEVFHINKGKTVPVDAGIKERWTVNDNCGFALDEAMKIIEKSLEETENDDEIV